MLTCNVQQIVRYSAFFYFLKLHQRWNLKNSHNRIMFQWQNIFCCACCASALFGSVLFYSVLFSEVFRLFSNRVCFQSLYRKVFSPHFVLAVFARILLIMNGHSIEQTFAQKQISNAKWGENNSDCIICNDICCFQFFILLERAIQASY